MKKKINIFATLLLSSFVLTSFGMERKTGRKRKRTRSEDAEEKTGKKRKIKQETQLLKQKTNPTPKKLVTISLAYGKPGMDKAQDIITIIKRKDPYATIKKIDVEYFANLCPNKRKYNSIGANYCIINKTGIIPPKKDKFQFYYQELHNMGKVIQAMKEIKHKINFIFIINTDIKLLVDCYNSSELETRGLFNKNASQNQNFIDTFDEIIPIVSSDAFKHNLNLSNTANLRDSRLLAKLQHIGALKNKVDYLNYITGTSLGKILCKNKNEDCLHDALYFTQKMKPKRVCEELLQLASMKKESDLDTKDGVMYLKNVMPDREIILSNKKIILKQNGKMLHMFQFLLL